MRDPGRILLPGVLLPGEPAALFETVDAKRPFDALAYFHRPAGAAFHPILGLDSAYGKDRVRFKSDGIRSFPTDAARMSVWGSKPNSIGQFDSRRGGPQLPGKPENPGFVPE